MGEQLAIDYLIHQVPLACSKRHEIVPRPFLTRDVPRFHTIKRLATTQRRRRRTILPKEDRRSSYTSSDPFTHTFAGCGPRSNAINNYNQKVHPQWKKERWPWLENTNDELLLAQGINVCPPVQVEGKGIEGKGIFSTLRFSPWLDITLCYLDTGYQPWLIVRCL
jgi:hypothetical protein